MNKSIIFSIFAITSLHSVYAMDISNQLDALTITNQPIQAQDESQNLWEELTSMHKQIKEKKKLNNPQEMISLRTQVIRITTYLLEQNPNKQNLVLQLKKHYLALKKLQNHDKEKVKNNLYGLADDLSDDENQPKVDDIDYQYFKKKSLRIQSNKKVRQEQEALKKFKQEEDSNIDKQILAIMGQKKQLEDGITKLKLQRDTIAKEIENIDLTTVCIENANDILEERRSTRKDRLDLEIKRLEAVIKRTLENNEEIRKQLTPQSSVEERFQKGESLKNNESLIKELKNKHQKLLAEYAHMKKRLENETEDGWGSYLLGNLTPAFLTGSK